MNRDLCILCKGGRDLCGKGFCELLSRVKQHFPAKTLKVDSLFGASPPSVFVGRHDYPNVNIGPMVPGSPFADKSEASFLEMPKLWFRKSIEDIIGFRSNLVLSRKKEQVKNARTPRNYLSSLQELAISYKPLDVELSFDKKVEISFVGKLDNRYPPMGPTVSAKRTEVCENPHVRRKVDYLIGDTDARASNSLHELHLSHVPVYEITRLLSVGLMGQEKNRRLVPTRWSITAVDDTLSKNLMNSIKGYAQITDVSLFQSELLGNHFYVILIPDIFSFDMVETWVKGAFWSYRTITIEDWEDHNGRTKYANKITGAYYAARLSVSEYLYKKQRQASVLVYREIHPDYYAPLGVWVIREGVARAFYRKPETFSTVDEAVEKVNRQIIQKKWSEHSMLLKERREQKKLFDFV